MLFISRMKTNHVTLTTNTFKTFVGLWAVLKNWVVIFFSKNELMGCRNNELSELWDVGVILLSDKLVAPLLT